MLQRVRRVDDQRVARATRVMYATHVWRRCHIAGLLARALEYSIDCARMDNHTAEHAERHDWIVWSLIGVGILLRAWQLSGNAALFLDELALARNITDRGYRELLAPLDYGQVAPPGFLMLQRFLWTSFHEDWALRIIPFVSSIASLFLMRALARRVLAGIAVPLAVGAIAIAPLFVMYASEVKQYSSKVAIPLALVVLAVRLLDEGRHGARERVLTGLAGFVAVWFCSSAIVVLAGLGGALTLLAVRNRLPERRRVLVWVVVPWALGCMAASAVARSNVSPETMAYMREFWRDGFPTFLPLTWSATTWPWRALTAMFERAEGLGYPVAALYALLSVAGFVMLWRTRNSVTLLLVAPIVVTVGIAVARLYPFKGRLVIYLIPLVVIAAAAAIARVAEKLRPHNRAAATAFLLLVIAGPIARIVAYHPVYRIQRTHRLFHRLNARRRAHDAVFVWYRAEPHIHWYGPRYGLARQEVINGGCWLTQPRRFLADLEPLRGQPRAWIIMTGSFAAEARMVLAYANTIGARLETISVPATVPGYGPMEALLYDFSDPVRLASAAAATFPISLPPNPRSALMGCALGPFGPRLNASQQALAAP
jgi:hypothetical protein